MELPKRKATRLPDYNYAEQNYYFITICTNEKKCIFGFAGNLNDYGKIALESIQSISQIYDGIFVDKYVVMPNHIHAIIAIEKENGVSLTRVVGQYKMTVTKRIHQNEKNVKVWQRSFHDHIIRNQDDYQRIWLYIHGNPQNWKKDCFYIAFEEE